MIGRKLTYILMVLITAYIGLMYDGPVPGMLLAFELLLFVLLFAVSLFLARSARIAVNVIDSVVDSQERAKIMIVFQNNSFLPISDAMLKVRLSNCLDDESEEYEMNLKAPAYGKVRVPFTYSSSYCGVVRVEFLELHIFDYLRLFRRKQKVDKVSECVIMPKLHEMQLVITEACRNFDSDSDEFDKNKPGDDPSEIFQLREYRQGDKMSRVHWKMTARLDTMMIKELSRPVSNSVGIYLDLRFRNIDEAQAVFELCYSLSMSMLAQECQHRIYWCKASDPISFEELVIRNAEDIIEGMSKLLTHGRKNEILGWDAFRSAHPQLAVHRMIAITCMDPEQDMTEFLAPDHMIKSVLTIDAIHELTEI